MMTLMLWTALTAKPTLILVIVAMLVMTAIRSLCTLHDGFDDENDWRLV
jgi:hypothetical protein